MSRNYILPLKAPTPLPASRVDAVTFKVWKNTLIAHGEQDVHNHHFMPGGLYSQWNAADDGSKISELHKNNHDLALFKRKTSLISWWRV